MKVRLFTLSDYEEVVNMLYEMNKEVYQDRVIGHKYSYYMNVSDWITNKLDIYIAEKDGEICGFTMSYIDTYYGLTEPLYRGELAYVKPKYRRGKAAYLLYNNIVSKAKELGLIIVSHSRIENKVDKMVEKHFNAVPKYTVIERRP